jgi:LysM repeat protein
MGRARWIALAAAILAFCPFPAGAGRGVQVHEVIPGDSLSSIAKRYHTTPLKIQKLNRMSGVALRCGQKLKIRSPIQAPKRIRGKYVVKRGDNLATVAKRHRIPAAMIRRLNPGVQVLRPGQRIWVVTEVPSARGNRRDLYELEPGPGYTLLEKRRAYGTMLAVSRIAEVLSDHYMKFPDAPPILVGDLSRKGGGFLAPHRSHRRGRDVDIRYPLKVPDTRYVPATVSTLDIRRTWSLLRAFVATGDVEYIFVGYKLQRALHEYAKGKGVSATRLTELFQYPRGSRSQTGIIRHEPGHRTHFHVRFKKDGEDHRPNS